jgi:cyclophilin family peptidyl-prolyl cis-trans isomerase
MINKKSLRTACLLVGALCLLWQACSPPKYPDGLYAELTTNKGLIVLNLEYTKTPMTVANFVGLSQGRIQNAAFPEGTPYFDGTVFHRVVPGHVIQAGSPDQGGSGSPGYTFPNEIHPDLGHGRAGMLGMANAGPHTNGSQFYITLGDRSYLDGSYTVFGQVLEGMEVVNSIDQGDKVERVKIVRQGKAARAFKADENTFRKLVKEAEIKIRESEKKKSQEEEAQIQSRWPQAQSAANGLRTLVLNSGQGEKLQQGAKVTLSFTGETLSGLRFSSSSQGLPQPSEQAEIFGYEASVTQNIPALEQSVMDMRPGETRLLIIPASLGFGMSGYYAPERKGVKRFVIPPYTTLVYQITLVEIN